MHIAQYFIEQITKLQTQLVFSLSGRIVSCFNRAVKIFLCKTNFVALYFLTSKWVNY